MLDIGILGLSIILQFFAAYLALRLIYVTGYRHAWILIAVAVIFMGVRRSITFFRMVAGDVPHSPDMTAELVALTISALMVTGIYLIRPVFISMREAEIKLGETAERLDLATNAASLGIWDWDIVNNILIWDDRMYSLYGVRKEDFGGAFDAWTSALHPDDLARCMEETQQALRSGSSYDTEFRVVWPDGTVHFIKADGLIVRDAEGKAVRKTGVNYDITVRKQQDAQIKASLQEKEVLLKEIHHRSKNNLQIISSLFNLQDAQDGNPITRRVFKDGKARIQAMALVHEKLYRSENLARINFSEYINGLAESVFQSYNMDPERILLKTHMDKDVELDINLAIPYGLIINELLSNSLKYAFNGKIRGEVGVRLSTVNGGIELTVWDDGTGLPPDIRIGETKTLGLTLVHTLLRQTGGTLDLDRNGGTAFKFKFPIYEK